jgi:hypothetical protein
MPPLAKFAAAPLACSSAGRTRHAAAAAGDAAPGRAGLAGHQPERRPGQRAAPGSDADIIAWYRKVQRYDAFWVPRSAPRAT